MFTDSSVKITNFEPKSMNAHIISQRGVSNTLPSVPPNELAPEHTDYVKDSPRPWISGKLQSMHEIAINRLISADWKTVLLAICMLFVSHLSLAQQVHSNL